MLFVLPTEVVEKGCFARACLSRQEEAVTGLGDNLMGNFYLGIGHVVTFENEKCISGAAVCPFRCVAVGKQRGRDAGRLVLAAPDERGLSPRGETPFPTL